MGAALVPGAVAPLVLGFVVLAASVLAVSAPTASAGDRAGSALPPELWAIELGAATKGFDRQRLVRLRQRGFNAVVLNTADCRLAAQRSCAPELLVPGCSCFRPARKAPPRSRAAPRHRVGSPPSDSPRRRAPRI